MVKFERARSREHKEERREEIMQAALELLETRDYEKITLAAIAEKLSFTRANLYKYVSSKDEIFLWITLRELSLWVEDLKTAFERENPATNREIASLWGLVLMDHIRVIKLFSLLYSLIERNVSVEKLAEFKGELFSLLTPLAGMMDRHIPGLSERGRWDFLNMQLHYAAGLYPASDISDRQREAMALAGIDFEIPDFRTDMTRFLLLLLEGLR